MKRREMCDVKKFSRNYLMSINLVIKNYLFSTLTDLDYVEGDFPVFRQTSRPPPSSNSNPFGSSNVFQQSFGNFFDFNPFPSFGNNFENFGFDSFNFRQQWHRG